MDRFVTFTATYLTQTAKAVLVEIDGEEYWLPDSQLGENSEAYVGCTCQRGDEVEVECSEWIAKAKGLGENR